jgi:hypothetical protein
LKGGESAPTHCALLTDLETDHAQLIIGFCEPQARLLSKAFRAVWDRLHPGVLVEPPSLSNLLLLTVESDDEEEDEEDQLGMCKAEAASLFNISNAQAAVVARHYPFRSRRCQGDTNSLSFCRPEVLMAVYLARENLQREHLSEQARGWPLTPCIRPQPQFPPNRTVCGSMHEIASRMILCYARLQYDLEDRIAELEAKVEMAVNFEDRAAGLEVELMNAEERGSELREALES